MQKNFNVTGSCNPAKHYMVDVAGKFEQVKTLVDQGAYFAINRPRQYGKTTMLNLLAQHMWALKDEYVLVRLSFEGVGDAIFRDEREFCPRFVQMVARVTNRVYPQESRLALELGKGVGDMEALSKFITAWVERVERPVVVFIDEVDKSSNNQLFLSFLGMLRTKYLDQDAGVDATFHSVVLSGVYDVKSLKLKIRDGGETKINSPWNIAADFNVDMSFGPAEIETMLAAYAEAMDVAMDRAALAERIHYYTSGYPFLVSKICKNIDEEAVGQNPDYDPRHWRLSDIDWSFRWLTRENYTTTNFDDLVKNLENNPRLYNLAYDILFGTKKESIPFSLLEPTTNLGVLYGLLTERNGRVGIHNLVYEQLVTNYIRAKCAVAGKYPSADLHRDYYDNDRLDLAAVLAKFQDFMREHYSDRDAAFLEREGRLVFLSFLKPIINGKGFMWKEPVVGDERRMDVVVTYGRQQKEVVELKVWRGSSYHQAGLQQLSDYLDFQNLKTGYLLCFDFNRNKAYKTEILTFRDKRIVAVWV